MSTQTYLLQAPLAAGRRRWLRAAALLAGGLCLAALTGCSSGEPDMNGLDMSKADVGKDFSLMGTDGQRHRLADFRGKAVLVFFGFTQCPDVCPTALTRVLQAKEMLGADGDRLQVIFITVDPERDTPDVLKAYVEAFDPGFLGLYGSPAEIRDTAREFKAFYQKIPTGSSYTMDHSSFNYLYDPQGRLRVALQHTQPAQAFASDIRQVLATDGPAS
ncbi:SCO family protein [Bordetella trematum]|nr:SCO1/SenC family protein [Bordetella trematum]VDH08399.1 BsSco [Bordetella trematum]